MSIPSPHSPGLCGCSGRAIPGPRFQECSGIWGLVHLPSGIPWNVLCPTGHSLLFHADPCWVVSCSQMQSHMAFSSLRDYWSPLGGTGVILLLGHSELWETPWISPRSAHVSATPTRKGTFLSHESLQNVAGCRGSLRPELHRVLRFCCSTRLDSRQLRAFSFYVHCRAVSSLLLLLPWGIPRKRSQVSLFLEITNLSKIFLVIPLRGWTLAGDKAQNSSS